MDLEILKIASDTRNHKVLKDSSHFAKFKNPLCGDEMNVSLMVKGEKITDFAYECKSCISVSYTHLRAHETREDLVWRLVR